MLIFDRNVHRKNQSCILVRDETFVIFTFLPFDRQTDVQNIYRKEAHILEEYAPKNQYFIFIRGEDNRVFNIFTFLLFVEKRYLR